jgi:outer membrane protein OmpA-like peptidoglycan-associated protein
MKQIKLAVIALFTLVSVSNVSAQDENNPWVVGFGINTVDVRKHTTDIGTNLEDYVGTEEWGGNTLPSISRITVDRYLSKGFTLQLAGAINKLSTIEEKDDADALYYSIDALVKYDLNNLVGETGWFDPYVSLGAGFQNIDHDLPNDPYDGRSDLLAVANVGFNTWFNDSLGLNFQTGYGHKFESSGFDTFRHSVALVIKFGGKDTDGDGVYDKEDACPEVPGLKEFNGCPDADGDGIKDSEDACPNVAGLAAMNGCPDSDGDGVADKDDACPNSKGTKANKGCPDSDRDGVVDGKDKCPKVAGPAANSGCPWPDTDGDGVLDKDDNCIKVAGPASNKGCPVAKPVITEEAKAAIDFAAKSILFNSARSSFKTGVVKQLNDVIAIMNQFPRANFALEGHTDSDGKASSNLALSNRRVNAVMNYFTANGISSSRLTAQGYGEDYPVDTNSTRAGKANNRRVVIKVTN